MIKGYEPTGKVRYIAGDKFEELANGKWRIFGLPDAQRSIGAFEDVVKYWTEVCPNQARKIADVQVDPRMVGDVEEQRWIKQALGIQ